MKSGIWALMSCVFVLAFGLPQSLAQSVKKHTAIYCDVDGPGTFPLDADSLPKAVVDSVMSASESKQVLGETGSRLRPEKLLHAAKIRLSSDGATAFLVIGSEPLSAADGSWFWIVRDDGAKASVLIWDAGNCVELENSEARGFRNVKFLWASAGTEQTDIYHYDGKAYKLAHVTRFE